MPEPIVNDNIGEPIDRVDGMAKVTGSAKYAYEYELPNLAYGVLVTSTIAKGKITNIDTKAASNAAGVIGIISYLNAIKIPGYETSVNNEGARLYGQELRVFYNEKIKFYNEPVAIVVADSFERAIHAAALIKVSYKADEHETDLKNALPKGVKPKRASDYKRGDRKILENAPLVVKETYTTPIQVHNPMEPHAVTVWWQDDEHVLVYNKTQAVKISQGDIVKAFHLPIGNVHVVSKFVGGAFGSSSRVWPQEMATLIAAKQLKRPVKLALQREHAFNMVGYRPASVQHITIGATAEGVLQGINHEAYSMTSTYEQFVERIIDPTKSMYACPYLQTQYRLVPLDVSTPCWTRGPGETSGSFALESAIDELAYKLKMDPLAFRIKNYAATDPESNLPWSSKYLMDCYTTGAERFGWHRRKAEPGSMKEGEMLVGMGMASGIYIAKRSDATARAVLSPDGSLLVQSATADVGPGTATVMSQIAAEVSGISLSNITFELGDSFLPPAPGQFGSHTVASVGSAVHEVCMALKQSILHLATTTTGSPFFQVPIKDLMIDEGVITKPGDTSEISVADVLKKNNVPQLELTHEAKVGAELKKYSSKAFCATFVEVLVHPLTGIVVIKKVVSVVDCGKVMNKKTAESQVYGSVVWGIGLSLMEEAVIDDRYGRFLNNNLADYHVPVEADIPAIDVTFIDKNDPVLNPMGAKGLGEIPLIGFSAAVANAVFHATGKRIRSLPITPDKLV